MKKSEYEKDLKVRVIGNSAGHGIKIGSIKYISKVHGMASVILKTSLTGRDLNYWVYFKDLEIINKTPKGRKEKAKQIETKEIPKIDKEIKELQVKRKELGKEAARLKKFPDKAAEVAFALSKAIKSGGEEKAIAKVIRDMGLISEGIED